MRILLVGRAKTGLSPASALLLLFAFAPGCQKSNVAPDGHAAPRSEAAVPSCPEPLRSDGSACLPQVTSESCPAGMTARVGEEGCVPVGLLACAPGWERADDGWSCTPKGDVALLEQGCGAGERVEVTDSGFRCVDVGDCAAPFPPAQATHFVDAKTSTPDSKTFRRIADAVLAAPEGSVIAIADGTYAEDIVALERPVTLVGRCPARTVIAGTRGIQAGIYVPGTRGVSVRGVRVTGHAGGIFVQGGSVTVEDVVLEANTRVGLFLRDGAQAKVVRSRIAGTRAESGGEHGGGIVVRGRSRAELEDVTLSRNAQRGLVVADAKTEVVATGLYVTDTQRVPALTDLDLSGVLVASNARLTVSASVVTHNDGAGFLVDGSSLVASDTKVSSSRGRLNDRLPGGMGVWVREGAEATLDRVEVAAHPLFGIYADGQGARVLLTNSSVYGHVDASDVEVGRGAQIVNGAEFVADNVAFVHLWSAGVAFQDGGHGTLTRSSIRDVSEIGWPVREEPYGGFGVLVESGSEAALDEVSVDSATLNGLSVVVGSRATASDVLLRGTRESSRSPIGSAAQVARSAELTLVRAILEDNRGTSMLVASGSTARVEDSLVRNTHTGGDGQFGHGICIFRDASVTLERGAIVGNAGIGLVSDGGSGLVGGTVIRENGIGLHAQNGATLVEIADGADVALHELRVRKDTRVEGNKSRIGSGLLPVPDVD